MEPTTLPHRRSIGTRFGRRSPATGSSAARAPSAGPGSGELAADIDVAFNEALGRPGGAVGRGPHRYYVEIHPQALRGFVDIVTHPWVQAVAETILGPDYRIIEVGFDVPGPGR